MKKLQIICFLLLVGFSTTFSWKLSEEITVVLTKMDPDPAFETHQVKGDPPKITYHCTHGEGVERVKFRTVNLFSVTYDGFRTCNFKDGEYVSYFRCDEKRLHWPFKEVKEGEMHFIVGASKSKAALRYEVGRGCTQNFPVTRFIVHVCDQYGYQCPMEYCRLSLGIGDRRIRDDQLLANSEMDDIHAAKYGRAHRFFSKKTSSWCAAPNDQRRIYWQVNLVSVNFVTAIATQGPEDEYSYVSSYIVHYRLDNDWIVHANRGGKIKEFEGKSNKFGIIHHRLLDAFYARSVRILPLSCVRQCCMRVELYGCKVTKAEYEQLSGQSNRETRPCPDYHCSHIPHSACFMYSGKRVCKCLRLCVPNSGKVCGTDGVTYQNECTFQKELCLSNKRIKIFKQNSCPACWSSIGLGDGQIADEQLSASSILDGDHAAKQGRVSLIRNNYNSPWCAHLYSYLRREYLQVDLLTIHAVSVVSTQGAVTENSWVSSYLVYYNLDGNEWIVLTDKGGEIKEFNGNSERSSIVQHWLKPHFHAQLVRFIPLSWVHRICMRVELHGCKKPNANFKELSEKLKNEPRLCEAAHCASVRHSTCFMYSGKPLCKCVRPCRRKTGTVCGTDGVTYQNGCKLEKAACLSKTKIYIFRYKPCPACSLSLGLGDGRIRDEQLSASSELDEIHAAKQGRVSFISPNNSRPWCAAPTSDLRSQYLQVDLLTIHHVSAVSTQGAVTENSWVKSYLVHYSLDGNEWIVHSDSRGYNVKEFYGNRDNSSLVRRWIELPFHARFVRFVPLTWVGQRCMRVELHGCNKANTSFEELSGNMYNKPKLCEAAHCASVPYSTCFTYFGRPRCRCYFQSCALSAGKVCGTDGVTYQNECKLKRAACLSKKQINISKRQPCPACPLSLGLGDGRIRDEQLSASSELDDIHAAQQGRASFISPNNSSFWKNSSWCAAPTFDLRSQHLQVDLLTIHYVSAVSTQGAVTENSWVSSYLVHYSLDGNEWIVLTDNGSEIKELNGNSDSSSLVHHWLKPHFHARFVRFVPLTWVGQRCMRVEIHGCNKTNTSFEKLSGNLKNEPRPCEAAHCASVPHSTCFMYSGQPLCKCVQSCALSTGKVCGTDGVTYQNECKLKKAACLSKTQINISKRQPCPACPLSLGLSDGRIRDEQLSASSKLDDFHAAKQGRVSLIGPSNNSSWCAAPTFDLRSQHLQVDLLTIHYVSAVSTQGSVTQNSWVSSYLMHYSLDGNEWIVLTDKGGEIKEFNGNLDQSSLVHHWLKPHFHARFVRFVPLSWVGQRCMRVELHGCNKANTSFEKLSGNLTNEPRPCEAAHCASVPHSTCFMYSGKPLCKCVKSCALRAGKVCGTDGVTYLDECKLKNAACLSKKQINISKRQPCPACPLSLGLSDGRIRDEQLSASSKLDDIHAAKQGRVSLIIPSKNSSWCAAPTFDLRSQHLQVDLLTIHYVSAVSAQGAVTQNSWVSSYLVHYSLNGKEWIVLTDEGGEIKEFNGNSDQSSLVHHWLKPHFHARFVRFVPLTWVGQRCMRVELHGCNKANTSLEKLSVNLKNEPRPCKAAHCASVPHSTCFMYSGKPLCKCVKSCALSAGKVCGTDGATYPNECEMKNAACLSKKQISISKRQPCPEDVDFHLAICGPSVCPPYSICESGDICVCTQCSNDGKKVCGSDGKTYKDFCELQKIACESNTTLKMTRKGSCQECAGKTCPPYANCVHSDSGFVCVCPDCSLKGGKVCGTDGKTYNHSCELQMHACKKNKNISIVSHGGCAGSGKKEHKLSDSLKTFYICMIAIGASGIAIVLALFLFQQAKSRTGKDWRKVSDLRKTENPSNSLQVEKNSKEDK